MRPHVVFPNELPAEFYKALLASFPGSGDAYVPIDPDNWTIITDGMAEVTEPGEFHTAGSAHLEGIDFAGKTGTAQEMSHEALEKTNKGRATEPNVWFVGVTPRRNPELVVAVLWQNGEFSYYPARIAAKVVEAYVDKQRRLAGNLPAAKAAAPVEMGAVWSEPAEPRGADRAVATLHGGSFLVEKGQVVAENVTPDARPTGQKATDGKARGEKRVGGKTTASAARNDTAAHAGAAGTGGTVQVAQAVPTRKMP